MGESGHVVISTGVGDVKSLFTQRAHKFHKEDERSTAHVYEVTMDAQTVEAGHNLTESIYSPVPGGAQAVPSDVQEGANGRTRRDVPARAVPTTSLQGREELKLSTYAGSGHGKIRAALTASSHVGWLRLNFLNVAKAPYVFIQATRQNWTGSIGVDMAQHEVFGSNPQRQDYALGPSRAPGFHGYFVSRFSRPFKSYGVAHGDALNPGIANGAGENLGAFVTFEPGVDAVEVRTGVSFVSIEQARRNLDIEASSGQTFDQTVQMLKQAWLEKLSRGKSA